MMKNVRLMSTRNSGTSNCCWEASSRQAYYFWLCGLILGHLTPIRNPRFATRKGSSSSVQAAIIVYRNPSVSCCVMMRNGPKSCRCFLPRPNPRLPRGHVGSHGCPEGMVSRPRRTGRKRRTSKRVVLCPGQMILFPGGWPRWAP